MPYSLMTLKECLPHSEVVTEIAGDPNLVVHLCSSAEDSLENSICFVQDVVQFEKAKLGLARAFVVPAKIKDVIKIPEGCGILFVKNHAYAHAQIAELVHGRYAGHETKSSTHPTAVVASTAVIGKNVRIGPNVFIGENVKIGDDVFIGANTVVENDCKIGNRTHLWPMVFIGRACVIRDDCHIHPNTTVGSEGFGFAHDGKGKHHRIPQLGNVLIQNRVEVGANCTIDRATFGSTVIGEGTKLDNLCHVAHNVVIGKNCLLTAGFKIAGSSKFGDNIVTGGECIVRDHVEVCSNVRLAAWSGVNNDITEPGDYGGHPLQKVRDYMKSLMCIPHLPEMRRRLSKFEQQHPKDAETSLE